jgi:hypothetical protein
MEPRKPGGLRQTDAAWLRSYQTEPCVRTARGTERPDRDPSVSETGVKAGGLLGNAGKIRDVAAKYGLKVVALQAKQPGWAAQ